MTVYFTKPDVLNMFGTWKLPCECAMDNYAYAFTGLPFGWVRSPGPTEELLGLSAHHPTATSVIQCLDNMLLFSPSLSQLCSESYGRGRGGWVSCGELTE